MMNFLSASRFIFFLFLLTLSVPQKVQAEVSCSLAHQESITIISVCQRYHSASDELPQMPFENKEKENEKGRERERESESKNKGSEVLLNLFVCYTLFNTYFDPAAFSVLIASAGTGESAINPGKPLFLSVRNIRV